VSTYGAKLAVPAGGGPGGELGAGDEGGGGGGDDAGAVGVGLALAVGLALTVGLAVGAGPPAWQEAPLMTQSAGGPAWPEEEVTKPTSRELPGAMSESQPSAVTVTLSPLTVSAPFHRLDTDVPAGSWKDSVQPETAAAPPLVIVYWPV
jgi:hypothetical protein